MIFSIRRFLVLFFICIFSSSLFAEEIKLIFKLNGKPFNELSLTSLKNKFPIKRVQMFNTDERKYEDYDAFDFGQLIEKIYGDDFLKMKEVNFYCRNKYQPYLPLETLKLATGYLAFQRSDGDKFNKIGKVEKQVNDLGPFYLIWDSTIKNNAGIKFPFIYQIVEMNLINVESKNFPNTQNEKIIEGYRHFKLNCLRCHSINNAGGIIGGDLKAEVLQKRDREGVFKYIENPQSLNPSSKMPPFAMNGQLKVIQINLILDYLFFMLPQKNDTLPKKPEEDKAGVLNQILDEAKKK